MALSNYTVKGGDKHIHLVFTLKAPVHQAEVSLFQIVNGQDIHPSSLPSKNATLEGIFAVQIKSAGKVSIAPGDDESNA